MILEKLDLTIPFEECTLIETNQYLGGNGASPALMVLVTVTTTLPTLICLIDPKACFGSCPTFYAKNGDSLMIQAEGFSSSITKSMEEIDTDKLNFAQEDTAGNISIVLKNEALETHFIRSVRLVSVESEGQEVFQSSNGRFYEPVKVLPPINVSRGNEVLNQLTQLDGDEFRSFTDSLDLTQKEEIVVEFNEFSGSDAGVILTHRQTLLTTFLFYQSLAYIGTAAGSLMAGYENSNKKIRDSQKTIYDVLGAIEVAIETPKGWKWIGKVEEHGPIARDTQLIPLNIEGDFRRIKLRMTQGLWKIDRVGIALQIKEKSVQYHDVQFVELDGAPDNAAHDRLCSYSEYLVTNPGDTYNLSFDVGTYDGVRHFFIESQGYYTEWMRQEWIREQNKRMTVLMLRNPKKWVKEMSPKYKETEERMEELFWKSKFSNVRF